MFNRLLNKALLMSGMMAAAQLSAEIIDGEEFVDPTRPLMMTASRGNVDSSVTEMIRNVVPASYDVSFVRASSTSPIAVINDQRVTIGDEIGGATVVAIDRNGVTLSINDQERRISVFTTNIKSAAPQ